MKKIILSLLVILTATNLLYAADSNQIIYNEVSISLGGMFYYDAYYHDDKVYENNLESLTSLLSDKSIETAVGLGFQYSLNVGLPGKYSFEDMPLFSLGVIIDFSFIGGEGNNDPDFIGKMSIGLKLRLGWFFNLLYGYGTISFKNEINTIDGKKTLNPTFTYYGLRLDYQPVFISLYYYSSKEKDNMRWNALSVDVGYVFMF